MTAGVQNQQRGLLPPSAEEEVDAAVDAAFAPVDQAEPAAATPAPATPAHVELEPLEIPALELPPGTKLTGKLTAIMKAVKRLPKRGYNAHFNYKFVRAEDVLEAVQQLLAEANVLLSPSLVNSNRREVAVTKEGKVIKTKTITEQLFTFTFVCGDTDARHECLWEGQGEDEADKGGYKAATGAQKTFIQKFFVIPTGDDQHDPEYDGGQAPKGQAQRGQQRSQQTTPAANRQRTSPPPPKQAGNGQQQAQPVQQTQQAQAPKPSVPPTESEWKTALRDQILQVATNLGDVVIVNGQRDDQATVSKMRMRLSEYRLHDPAMVATITIDGQVVPSLKDCSPGQLRWILGQYQESLRLAVEPEPQF